MPHLFVYGTLMVEEVASRVIAGRYRHAPATLPGYARWKIKGEEYPGIARAPESSVAGVVWFDVTASDLARLDAFEGEEYDRAEVQVLVAGGARLAAAVYRVRDSHLHRLDDSEWDRDHFERLGLSRFMERYRGLAHRERLAPLADEF